MSGTKSAALIALAHISKLGLGLFFIKIVSVYLGPEGLGSLGHLISFVTILFVFSGGGIQNGIVKYVSEYKTKPVKLYKFLIESMQFTFVSSLLISVLLLITSRQMASWVFGDEELYWIIIFLAILQLMMSLTKLILGVSNGFKDTFVFSSSVFIGNILSMPISWYLVANFNFMGAVFATSVAYVLTFLALYYHYNKSVFKGRFLKKTFPLRNFTYLHKFSLMTLVSSLSIPLVEIFIRQLIIDSNGYADAGLWQAANKLSAAYMGFFALYMAYYILPTLSACKDIKVIIMIISKNALMVALFFIVFSILFYNLKDFLIENLMSTEFLQVSEHVHFLLLGDFFKILSFLIAFLYVSKSIIWAYILMEVIQGLLLLSITYFSFSEQNTLHKIFEAYAFSNLFYILLSIMLMIFVIKTNYFKQKI